MLSEDAEHGVEVGLISEGFKGRSRFSMEEAPGDGLLVIIDLEHRCRLSRVEFLLNSHDLKAASSAQDNLACGSSVLDPVFGSVG